MRADEWETSKSSDSSKVCVRLLLFLNNSVLRPSNWKFELSPRPHPHSDPIINTHTEWVKKIYVWIYHGGMHWTSGYSSLSHWKARIWLPLAFTTKTHWGQAQDKKSQPTPCKTRYAFPCSPLGYGVLTQIYSLSDWALDWGLSLTLRESKMCVFRIRLPQKFTWERMRSAWDNGACQEDQEETLSHDLQLFACWSWSLETHVAANCHTANGS